MIMASTKVKEELQSFLDRGFGRAISVVYVLIETVKRSEAGTIMEIEKELRETAQVLKEAFLGTNMAVRAAVDTFLSSVGTLGLEEEDFEGVKRCLIEAGEAFLDRSEKSRERIAHHAEKLIPDGSRILTLSKSRAVFSILEAVVAPPRRKNIKVFVAESRPDSFGYEMAARIRKLNIPTTVLVDAAIGSLMEQIDFVLLGAEAAMENGGVVNTIGSFQLAMAAKAFGKPLYVALESYKFARMYPLSQKELQAYMGDIRVPLQTPTTTDSVEGVEFFNPPSDLTPPEYISLLFTDEGVLTPAAVSELLMRADVVTEEKYPS